MQLVNLFGTHFVSVLEEGISRMNQSVRKNQVKNMIGRWGWLRVILLLILAITVVVSSAAAQTDYSTLSRELPPTAEDAINISPEASLADYLRLAMERSPRLRAAFQDWQAALEKTGHVGALPDPMISFSHFIENVETRVGPQENRFGLWQTFPWLGLLNAKKDMASAAARAAFERLEMERLRLFYNVKSVYYNYFFINRDLAITRENVELLTFWESVARSKYKVGLEKHPDLIKIQVELGKLEDHLQTVEESIEPVVARFRALLDLPDTVTIPPPSDIEVAEQELSRDSLIALVRTQNPTLKALAHTVDREHAGTRLARGMNRPNFSFGIDYIQTGEAVNPSVPESGKDPWFVGAKISLPIWFGKNSSRSGEAEARLKSAQYRVRDAENRLVAATENVLFEYADALRKLRLYRDGLVPKAEQSLNATYAAYKTGEADFLAVLDAQRQLLDFELTAAREKASLAARRAELEMLTGSSINKTGERNH